MARCQLLDQFVMTLTVIGRPIWFRHVDLLRQDHGLVCRLCEDHS